MLLFGKTPERFFKHAEITLVRYPGDEPGDEFLREDIRKTLPEMIREAEVWLVANMRKYSRLTGLDRQDFTEYPVEAVREAVVNAVAHRDYSIRGEGIRISMFAKRVEFYSPGRLPGQVTVHNIADERFSRNETIVQVLADMGLIERLGYGINRIMRLMADWGLSPPAFAETARGFVLTLHGRGEESAGEKLPAERHKWMRLGLSERQVAGMDYLVRTGRITNREYRDLAPEVTDETVRRDLAELVDKDLLLRIGDKRATYYILK
jgi:ATP-dependent DNA helicase RecG